MKRLVIVSFLYCMCFVQLNANGGYFESGMGFICTTRFDLKPSLKIGYQIIDCPTLFFTLEAAVSSTSEIDYFYLTNWTTDRPVNWRVYTQTPIGYSFLAPGIIYYPLKQLYIATSIGKAFVQRIKPEGFSEFCEYNRIPFAFNLSTAYDFTTTRKGFLLGIQYFWADIGTNNDAYISILIKYRWKGRNPRG
jgi:hypothetical protein